MYCGIQLGLLRNEPWSKAIDAFFRLQSEFPLKACELHLEACLYEAALRPWKAETKSWPLSSLRGEVNKLGVHLPFIDLNPISPNPRVRETSKKILEESLGLAAKLEADYVVFHARGQRIPASEKFSEMLFWKDAIGELAGKASALGLTFCLENADDLREVQKVRDVLGLSPRKIKLCLDIAHLYERIYPSSPWLKGMLLINDRISPLPFAVKSGLPAAAGGGWPGVLDSFLGHVRCLHVHNHDGKQAHRPLRRGKIDLGALKKFKDVLKNIPVIVEADYREEHLQTVRGDLRYLTELI